MLPATLSKRVRTLSQCKAIASPAGKGGVVYWMSRDQRVQDNWVSASHPKKIEMP